MNITLMVFGAIGALSFFFGNWIINRISKNGTALSISDVLPLLFFLALSAIYTGLIFSDAGKAVSLSVQSLFSTLPVTWGRVLASWSVGSTFAVTMHTLAPKSSNVSTSATDTAKGGLSEDTDGFLVERKGIVHRAFAWLVSGVDRKL